MDREALQHYLADGSRRGPAAGGALSGSAGGAPCGDLVRLSLSVRDGRIESVTQEAEGCAASRAAAAAAAALAEGTRVLDAARIGAAEIDA
ncbi:MAG TPA: iron-sulfur cluster assembly scaffold protein, partial [Solirubrobacterales bacterium]|nr:iron-sulfur cluster assembly scaffold protein [Solirubrobacterales bacterium]